MKRVARIVAAIGLAFGVAACAQADPISTPVAVASPAPNAPFADDPIAAKRIATLPMGRLSTAVEWFEPTVRLAPSPAPVPIAAGPRRDAAFADAIALGDAANSTALLIYHRGTVRVERYGQGADASTTNQTQSMHKSIVGIATMAAIEDGAIRSLDQPASDFIDDWIAQPFGTITVRHLLNMVSGLEMAQPGTGGLGMRLFVASDIDAVARSVPQARAPGEVFEYNNVNVQLLVTVLEAATGEAYEEYLQRRVWSRFAERDAFLWMDRAGGTPHGFCCIISTARDWMRLGRMLLGENQGTPAQVLNDANLLATMEASAVNPNYGALIWRGTPYQPVRKYRPTGEFGAKHSAPYAAPDVIFLDGFGGQRLYVVPSRDLVIVRTGPEIMDWDDAALPNAVLAALDAERLTFSDCETCPTMVALPAGTVTLGSDAEEIARYDVPALYAAREQTRATVSIGRPFAIGETEVTRGQFARFATATGYRPQSGCYRFAGNRWTFDEAATWREPGIAQTDLHPVTCVNANDAQAYTTWLTAETGRAYRLPSEAEWEYAARGGRPGATYWNDSIADACLFANLGDLATDRRFRWTETEQVRDGFSWRRAECDDGHAATAPVGALGANPFGLHDMLGNINEWTADCFTPNHSGHPETQDPRPQAGCEQRVLKGHTWTGNERTARPAFRLRLDPADRRFNLGFRVVADGPFAAQ